MALPEDHLAKFHNMADAKEMWEAIKSRFGGNDEYKKMQKYLLKQHFEGFSVSASEGLHKGYDKFQTLLSQLDIHGAGVTHEDANQKFLRSLPSSWSQVALIMRTKPGLDTLSFNDLYNNLRVFEHEVKGTTASSSSNIQNVAFVSADNTSSTNDVSSAYSVSLLSVSKSHKKGSSSYTDEVIHSFFVNQSSSPQLDYDDLEQINDDDMEEIDLKWQMAMISKRIKKFHKRTGRKLYGSILSYENEVLQSVFMNNECDLEDTPVNDRYADGMHEVPPPMIGNYMPYGPDVEIDYSKFTYGPKQISADESDSKPVEYAFSKSDSSVETTTSMPAPVDNAPKIVCKPKVWTDAPIIEEYESNSDDDSVSNVHENIEKPSFAFTDSVKHVKSHRENIKETSIPNHISKIEKQDRYDHTKKGLGYTRKACFVCGSFSHLIRDCDFHEKRMAKQAALTKSKDKAHDRNKAHLADYQEIKGGFVAFGGSNGRIAGKGKIKASRSLSLEESKRRLCFSKSQKQEIIRLVWSSHHNSYNYLDGLAGREKISTNKDKGIIDSGCSRHMTGNKAHLANYQEFKGGPVAFEGSIRRITSKEKIQAGKLDFEDNKVLFTDTDCLVLSPDFKFPDENQVLLKIPRQHNMYSFNLKNIDPSGDLTYLFAKALIDESNKSHRRLERKQHKTSCKAKTVISVNQPIQILHMDIFGPTSVRSINHKTYCLVITDGFRRSNNGTEFKNHDLIEFYGLKGIKREYSNARTSQQNGVVERKNRTLIEAARTMLADSFLPTTFWEEVVNTACTQANEDQSANSEEIDLHEEHFVLPIWSAYSTTVKSSVNKIENKTDAKPCVVTDFNNLETTVNVSPTPTTIIHTIHSKTQLLGDPMSVVQTRSKVHKNSEAHALIQKVWILVDFPFRKKAIGTKWVYKNKKDERGSVVRNNARLVAQGHRQEEGIDYDEDFAHVARIEAIWIFLAFASYMGFIVYQMDLKSTFLYDTIDEEVYVTQPPGFVDSKFPNKKSWCDEFEELMKNRFQMSSMVELAFFLRLHTGSTPIKTQRPLVKDEEVANVDSVLVLDFRLLQRLHTFKLSRGSLDSDYAGANLDRKSITKGCQFLGRRLISWQCNKQTIMATSTTEAEYVAAAHCCGQVLWIQNQLLDYGFNIMSTKTYIDNECTICIMKNPVFHFKTKHIEIRHHFIRDAYKKKLIRVLKIHTDDNVADLVKKAFDVSRFNFLAVNIRLLNL
nr:ribonuclease H-like domain-containing protein [Tanacetum cinerariifolium]